MFSKFIAIGKDRWKYILAGYILGWIIPRCIDGTPNIYYLFPIKAAAVGLAWTFGNIFYMSVHKSEYDDLSIIIHVIIGMSLMLITLFLIKIICGILGINPRPFLG